MDEEERIYFEIYSYIDEAIFYLNEAKRKINKLFIEKSFDNEKGKKDSENENN